MYNKIVNPKTGRKVLTASRLGKSIIKKYIAVINKQSGGVQAVLAPGTLNRTVTDMRSMTACTEVVMRWLGVPLEEELLRAGSGATGGVGERKLLQILNDYKTKMREEQDRDPDLFYKIDFAPITMTPHLIPRPVQIEGAMKFIDTIFKTIKISPVGADDMELEDGAAPSAISENIISMAGVEARFADGQGVCHMILIGILPGNINFILDIHGSSRPLPSSGLWLGNVEIIHYLKGFAGVGAKRFVLFNNGIIFKERGGYEGGASGHGGGGGPGGGASAVDTCTLLTIRRRGLTNEQVKTAIGHDPEL